MAIQAIKCPGYYERGDGVVTRMNSAESAFEPVIIQEVGDQIRVLCRNCIEGKCVSGVGKIDDKGLEGTGDQGARQTECVYLKNA